MCFAWSSNRVFFLMNDMILMLLTVHADIVQQVATTCKFNEWFWLKIIKCSIPSYISVHFLFSISLKSSTCIPQKLLVYACIPLPFQTQ